MVASLASIPSRRQLLRSAILAASGLAMPAAAWSLRRPDAIVSSGGHGGTLPSLGAAIDVARRRSGPFAILVVGGVYEEKLHIDRPDLTIVGAGPDAIIRYGASAGQPGPDGKPWGTGGSATLTVEAPGVTLSGLTILNSFDFFSARPSGPYGGRQAVALSLAGGADRTIVQDCRILGYQDTLYVREGRALFDSCRISGGTDFIFGGAAALFRRCEIVSRFIPGVAIQGYVAAPSTKMRQEIGLVFDRCRLAREASVPDASVFLGRPWRAGGNMDLTGFAAFIHCWMDRHIRPEGWTAMHYGARGGAEGWLTPQQARLYERGSTGPGAGRASPVRRQLPPEFGNITDPRRIFGDWNPD
jgi:pectinesterase